MHKHFLEQIQRILYVCKIWGAGRIDVAGIISSNVSKAIILLLYRNGFMTSGQVGEAVNLDVNVRSYLRYLRKAGYVGYSNGYWYLAGKGRRYAEDLLRAYLGRQSLDGVDGKIVGLVIDKILNEQRSKFHVSRLQDIESVVRCAIERIRGLWSLGDSEVAVARYVAVNVARGGKSYVYASQIARDLSFGGAELVEVLKRLETANIVYVYWMKSDARVGISRRSLMNSAMKECRSVVINVVSATIYTTSSECGALGEPEARARQHGILGTVQRAVEEMRRFTS